MIDDYTFILNKLEIIQKVTCPAMRVSNHNSCMINFNRFGYKCQQDLKSTSWCFEVSNTQRSVTKAEQNFLTCQSET